MSHNKLKPKKDSLIEVVDKYGNNHIACVNYFFSIKWPDFTAKNAVVPTIPLLKVEMFLNALNALISIIYSQGLFFKIINFRFSSSF